MNLSIIRNKKHSMKTLIKTLSKTLITTGVFYLFFSFLNFNLNPSSWNHQQRLAVGLVGIVSFFMYQPSPKWERMKGFKIEPEDQKLNS